MSRTESNSDGKLRAACERCRDLKNRCTRTGDPDSRCDRCERLDIDCVYGTNARMGRPRISKPALERSGSGRARLGEGSVRSPSFQSSRRTVHVDLADPSSRNGTENIHPMLDILDSALLPEVMYKEILDCDLPLYPTDFTQPTNDDPTIENANRAFHSDACNVTVQGFRQREEPEDFAYSDHGLGISREAIGSRTGTDELLRLQCRLHNLLSLADEATTRDSPAVDEVLVACKDFLEIIQATLAAQSHYSEFGVPFALPGRSPSQSSDASYCGNQRARPNLRMSNCVTVLQVLTCYGYVLQLLEPIVDALASRTGDTGFISLGTFSLASQPAMSSYVAIHMVLGMINQLRDSIHLLASGYKELGKASQRTQPFQASAADMVENVQTTITTNSIQIATSMVTEKETILVQRLTCFTKSSYHIS
ncbi:hypothetical protein F5B20DRAFT_519381 [Whalleya microplaca]|nr:hypothetical protein F5B20DRAFT_519381 [Whalleya microplaca]